MSKLIPILFILVANDARAALQKQPIKSHIALKPGQKELITVPSNEAMEIGWDATQAQKCAMHCVEATDKSGGYEYTIATDLGASMKYQPVDGRIIIEYKNKADHPVTIDVYRLKRTCDAEACTFVSDDQKTRWLVFKVGEFKSIETSKDRSYSVISGVTTAGKEFTVKAVWWTDNNVLLFTCHKTIKDYLDKKTPTVNYAPYILSGAVVKGSTGGKEIILKNIDTCVPRAPHFGVPQENVYY
jgi:hypothetical protein